MLGRPRLSSLALPSAIALAVLAACASEPPGTTTSGAGGAGGASTSTASSSSSGPHTTSATGTGGLDLPQSFTVSGVVTDGEKPVEGAIVMQAGGEPALTTGPDGAFTIELTRAIPGTPTVVAAKIGARSAGVEFIELPDGPVELILRAANPPDNAGYQFGDPGIGDEAHDTSTKFCGHCHTTLVKQFQTSAHAKATRDPLVQDLYAGVASAITTQAACEAEGGLWRSGLVPGTKGMSAGKCYVGAGVLPDLNPPCAGGALACDDPAIDPAQKPTKFGRCADCHAPGIDGPAGGRDLHEAVGVAFQHGNHCDVCHHARDVDLTKPPGVAGALVLQRPHEKVDDEIGGKLRQVMFGPRMDVPNSFMGGSYQPKFEKADFCGACHEQRQEAMLPGAALDPARWPDGLPTHSTFSEWSAGPYNAPGTPCQHCHMPPENGLVTSIDVGNASNADMAFGFVRKPGSIRKHIFRGPLAGAPRLIDTALTLEVAGAKSGGDLAVTVKLGNTGAGHAIPTGEPMRSLLLLVRAEACGSEAAPIGGMTIDDWGGALASATVGDGVSANGASITWAIGAAKAKVGAVVRAARPTGGYDDYAGIGFFANPALSAKDKGRPILAPVGEAKVTSVANGVITIDSPLALQPGDRLWLGDALTWPPADGAAPLALAGSAGTSFARTLVDPQGRRGAPHYRAVDIVSDNRIAPKATATSTYTFALPPGCASATVRAAVIYRPAPQELARERGWDTRDYVVAATAQPIALP